MVSSLERMRIERRMTQESLASAVGIGVSTLSMYENGLRSVPKDTAERIAQILACDVNDIFLPTKFTVSELGREVNEDADDEAEQKPV